VTPNGLAVTFTTQRVAQHLVEGEITQLLEGAVAGPLAGSGEGRAAIGVGEHWCRIGHKACMTKTQCLPVRMVRTTTWLGPTATA